VTLGFEHRGRRVNLEASGAGWAAMYLKQNPWSPQRSLPEGQYEERWRRQDMVAVNSILRDWLKGQVTAIETGVLSFHQVFLPYMLTTLGKTVADAYLLEERVSNEP